GPPLTVSALSDQSILLSWPAYAREFLLEETVSLAADASWQPVSQGPQLQNNQFTVTITPTARTRFYRLRQLNAGPALRVTVLGSQNILLSWPASAGEFVLEETV